MSLAHFLGTNPNGAWKLFVVDDTDGSTGAIAGGWSLTITTLPTLVTGAGAGGGPHVRFFDVDGAGTVTSRGQGVLAYAPFFTGGVFVGAGFIRTDVLTLLPGVVTGAGAVAAPTCASSASTRRPTRSASPSTSSSPTTRRSGAGSGSAERKARS